MKMKNAVGDSFPANGYCWAILTLMCLITYCVAFTTTSVMNALPIIHRQLLITPGDLQWVVNAYAMAAASFIVVAGQLGDMLTKRPILIFGGLLFVVTSFIIGFSHAGWQLIAGRFLQGISAAFLVPNSLSVVKVVFPAAKKKMAVSIWAGVVLLGFSTGPLGGGIIIYFFSWRLIFFITSAVIALCIFVFMFIPKQHLMEKRKIMMVDVVGFILLIAGIMPFILGLVEGNGRGWLNPVVWSLIFSGVLLLVVFCFYEAHFKAPLIHIHHFANRYFVAAAVGAGITVFLINSVFYFFNLYAQNPSLLAYGAMQAGLALLPMSLAIFCLSFFTNRLIERWGFRGLNVVAFIIAGLGFFWLSQLGDDPSYWVISIGLLLLGIGLGLGFTSLPALGMSILPDAQAGEASGIINTAIYFLGTLGLVVGTIVFVSVSRQAVLVNMPHMSAPLIQAVDHAAMGHSLYLQQHLAWYSKAKREFIIRTVQASSILAFHSVMWLNFIVCCVEVVIAYCCIPPRKKV